MDQRPCTKCLTALKHGIAGYLEPSMHSRDACSQHRDGSPRINRNYDQSLSIIAEVEPACLVNIAQHAVVIAKVANTNRRG